MNRLKTSPCLGSTGERGQDTRQSPNPKTGEADRQTLRVLLTRAQGLSRNQPRSDSWVGKQEPEVTDGWRLRADKLSGNNSEAGPAIAAPQCWGIYVQEFCHVPKISKENAPGLPMEMRELPHQGLKITINMLRTLVDKAGHVQEKPAKRRKVRTTHR